LLQLVSFFIAGYQLLIAKSYKYLSDMTGVRAPAEAYSLSSLTHWMKKMETKNSISGEVSGSLEVTFKHQDYGDHTLKLEGQGILFSKDGFFHLTPGYREIDGHRYYMGIKFRTDLEVGNTYTLDRNDEPVRAHLEMDNIEGDKYASGTFRLSKGGQYPEGEFNLFEEGLLSAEGTFMSLGFKA